MDIRPNERIDDLEINGYKIIQDQSGFCFGIDSVLISDFAKKIKKLFLFLYICDTIYKSKNAILFFETAV